MSVAGASQYRNAAILANTKNLPAASTSLLSASSSDTAGLLSVGRALRVGGTGLSENARQLNNKFLSLKSEYNAMFSTGVGMTSSVEALQKGILALRSKLSDNQLSRSLRGEVVDKKV